MRRALFLELYTGGVNNGKQRYIAYIATTIIVKNQFVCRQLYALLNPQEAIAASVQERKIWQWQCSFRPDRLSNELAYLSPKVQPPGSELCKDTGLVFVLACVLCVMFLCLSYLSPRVEPPGSELCKGSGFVFVFVLASVFVYVEFVFFIFPQ